LNDIPISPIFRFAHAAMATEFELILPGDDREYYGQAAQAVFAEIDRLEHRLSRFDPRSDLSLINRLPAGKTLRIGIETFECLSLAVRLQDETRGAFDIDFRSGRRPKRVWETSRVTDGFEVDLDAGVDLDLGGIGKGFALDKAREVLADWEIERYLMHGGTSTALAWGSSGGDAAEPEGWPLGVAGAQPCPGAPRRAILRNRALSGSGTEAKGEHIIDPRNGRPAQGHEAAWVSHPSAAVADALSTAFMVMPPAQVDQFCRRHPEVWALMICAGKKCTIFNGDRVKTDAAG
jgi:thiamine biosynthesis lipoprotein